MYIHTAVQQQRYNSSRASSSLRRDSHGSFACVFVRLCVRGGQQDSGHHHIFTPNATIKHTSSNLIPSYCFVRTVLFCFPYSTCDTPKISSLSHPAGRGTFLAVPAAGHAGAPARTLQRMFGLRPSSVARFLGVQRRPSWFFFKGLRSAPPSRAGPCKPQTSASFIFAVARP